MRFSKLILFIFIISYAGYTQEDQDKTLIDITINEWHEAAAEADFATYSNLMTKNAVFIGTDPTEYWKGEAFLDFAKPYFDKGEAWTFHTLERKIYIGNEGKTAWFDELLDTHMGVCRGSGVLLKINNKWKIKHYVLSISIPNDNVEKIKDLNNNFNQSFIESLKIKK